MFEVLPPSSDSPLRVVARDRLSHADYAQLVAQLEQSLARHDVSGCWIELIGFEGVEPGALVNKTPFTVHHCRKVQHCAILGGWAWSLCMTQLARSVFPEAQVRYFEPTHEEEAHRWISRQLDEPALAHA